MTAYDDLGLEASASKDEIKRAYKRLAMKHHPDKDGGDAECFKHVCEAYAILSDDDSRARYDAPPVQSHAFGEGFPGMDIFMGMGGMAGMAGMSGMGGMAGMAGMGINRTRNNHLHVLNVTLAEVFSGITKTLKVNVQRPCGACVSSKPCNGCSGTGVHRQTHCIGNFRQVVSIVCAACGGKGAMSCANGNSVCPTCENSRLCRTEHVLTMDVPRGAQSGHNETFGGLGEQGATSSEKPGDLIVELKVTDDPIFTRNGDDLLMTVTVSLWESIIGKVVVVPMFGGELKFNTSEMDTGIVQPGRRYVLSEFGMPLCVGPKGKRGALVISFVITYPPERLSAATKEALDRILAA